MEIVTANVFWIMAVGGGLTMTMLFAAVAPHSAIQSMFGDTLDGPLAEIIVRNWGALIALVGGMLVYGAYHEPVRELVLIVAIISKTIYLSLILSQAGRYAGQQVMVAVVADLVMVALFGICLLGIV
jgi:hypothetical protein